MSSSRFLLFLVTIWAVFQSLCCVTNSCMAFYVHLFYGPKWSGFAVYSVLGDFSL